MIPLNKFNFAIPLLFALILFSCFNGSDDDKSNATLAQLTLSGEELSPAFSPDVTEYFVTTNKSGVFLTATASSEFSTVEVNERQIYPGDVSEEIPLVTGNNTLKIKVTAQDGKAQIYVIRVTKNPGNQSTLQSLTLSIDPFFELDSAVNEYAFSSQDTSVNFVPLLFDTAGSMTINGLEVESGELSQNFSLKPGVNVMDIQVIAEDNINRTMYQLVITRDINMEGVWEVKQEYGAGPWAGFQQGDTWLINQNEEGELSITFGLRDGFHLGSPSQGSSVLGDEVRIEIEYQKYQDEASFIFQGRSGDSLNMVSGKIFIAEDSSSRFTMKRISDILDYPTFTVPQTEDIRVDGDLLDWDNVPVLLSDEEDDAINGGTSGNDILEAKFSRSDDSLFFFMRLASNIDTAGFTHFNFTFKEYLLEHDSIGFITGFQFYHEQGEWYVSGPLDTENSPGFYQAQLTYTNISDNSTIEGVIPFKGIINAENRGFNPQLPHVVHIEVVKGESMLDAAEFMGLVYFR